MYSNVSLNIDFLLYLFLIYSSNMTLCSYCNKKKVSLIPFNCKCNPNYKLCSRCRMPQDHKCTYDFKTEERKKLALDNPVVIADKIDKI